MKTQLPSFGNWLEKKAAITVAEKALEKSWERLVNARPEDMHYEVKRHEALAKAVKSEIEA